MDNFIVQPDLYFKARNNVNNVSRRLTQLASYASNANSGFPPEYPYVGEVENIYNELETMKAAGLVFQNKVEAKRAQLELLDSDFYNYSESVRRKEEAKAQKKLLEETGATAVVAVTSTLSGILKVGEHVVDGLDVVGADVISLYWGLQGRFDKVDEIQEKSLDFIRRDLVGEANKKFYEDTEAGRKINSKSKFTYDSNTAKAITGASEFATKIVAATALTMVGGPLAAPVVGFVAGVGESGERYAQTVNREAGEKYDVGKAIRKEALGGVIGAADWYGFGQLGKGVAVGSKALAGTAEATTFGSTTPVNFGKSLFKQIVQKDALAGTAAVVVDTGLDYAYGDISKEEAAINAGSAIVLHIAGAVLGASAETAIANKASKKLNNLARRVSKYNNPGEFMYENPSFVLSDEFKFLSDYKGNFDEFNIKKVKDISLLRAQAYDFQADHFANYIKRNPIMPKDEAIKMFDKATDFTFTSENYSVYKKFMEANGVTLSDLSPKARSMMETFEYTTNILPDEMFATLKGNVDADLIARQSRKIRFDAHQFKDTPTYMGVYIINQDMCYINPNVKYLDHSIPTSFHEVTHSVTGTPYGSGVKQYYKAFPTSVENYNTSYSGINECFTEYFTRKKYPNSIGYGYAPNYIDNMVKAGIFTDDDILYCYTVSHNLDLLDQKVLYYTGDESYAVSKKLAPAFDSLTGNGNILNSENKPVPLYSELEANRIIKDWINDVMIAKEGKPDIQFKFDPDNHTFRVEEIKGNTVNNVELGSMSETKNIKSKVSANVPNVDIIDETDILDENISYYSKKWNISEKETKEVIQSKLNQLFDESNYARRDNAFALEKSLDEGYIKNSFEAKTSDGYYDLADRKIVEKRTMNIDMSEKDGNRPVYGMLIPNHNTSKEAKRFLTEGPGCWYGYPSAEIFFSQGPDAWLSTEANPVVIIFDKEKIEPFTTFTMGDSYDHPYDLIASTLVDKQYKGDVFSSMKDISLEDFKNSTLSDVCGDIKGKSQSTDQYIELQIHGKEAHSVDNIKEVIFIHKPSEGLIEKLSNHNIPWSLLEDMEDSL